MTFPYLFHNYLIFKVLLFIICGKTFGEINNVCPTFKDYYTIRNNSNCWHDFTAEAKASEIIHRNGYPVEEYKVTTHDGYILTMFRIPNQNKQPVFLLHGVQCTCAMFISLGRRSLAFMLFDAGYDVWLGNFRGTEYSEGHVNLTVYDKLYWNHGADEIALLDVPAMLNTIGHETGQKGNIIYIGHSLGTSVAMMYSSEFPDEAKKMVKLFILLSPAYSLAHMRSPYRTFASFAPVFRGMLIHLRAVRLVSQAEITRGITKQICLESTQLMQFCLGMFNLFFGVKTSMGPETAPVLLNQFPGGTGLKVFRFLADMISNKFQKYDYGIRNTEVYGKETPPIYDVTKIIVPIYIIYSVGDWATTKEDSLALYKILPSRIRFGIHEVKDPNVNHMDFAYGRHAKELIYDPILEIIEKINLIAN